MNDDNRHHQANLKVEYSSTADSYHNSAEAC